MRLLQDFGCSRAWCVSVLALWLGACSAGQADGDPALSGATDPAASGTPNGSAAGAGAPGAAGQGTDDLALTGDTGSAGDVDAQASAGDNQGAAGAGADDGSADATPDQGDGDVVDDGADDGADDGDGSAAAEVRPPCKTNINQVAILGDSYIDWVSHTFLQDMANAAGEKWRSYAVGGYAMGSGGIGLIPATLDLALADDPDIQTVVMTGGGNDVLVPDPTWPGGGDCKMRQDSASLKVCQDIVQKALDAANELMQRAADAGVKDVVYFFYPHVPEGTLIGGTYPNAILDYALPRVEELCDATEAKTDGRMRCHFVNTIPLFEGKPELFAPTDIHENAAGSKVIADAIWERMSEECLAQPESSGCCEP